MRNIVEDVYLSAITSQRGAASVASPVQEEITMHVLIVRDSDLAFMPDDVSDIVVIGASPIDFPIDFGPMMDRWGGGVAIATIAPLDKDLDAYRVMGFQDIPVTFRQSGEGAFVLDSLEGDWFLSFTSTEAGIEVEQAGQVPDLSEPPFAPLGQFIEGSNP